MSPWGITVIVSLAIALLSMLSLIFLRGRNRKNYSNCFWKGFFLAFVITSVVFAALASADLVKRPLILVLPVALAVGSLAGLLLEIIRNKLADRDFWKKC